MGTAPKTNGTVEAYQLWADPIHRYIKLHPLLVKIIVTPEFQRLRDIKQLGGTCRVFIGASHNRFEHSIGVCYLAGELVQHLKENQPELEITDEEVLCIKIAGLCHDLGQGPFSRLFDRYVAPSFLTETKTPWSPKEASVLMFEHLIKENKLQQTFDEFKLGAEHIRFIKDLLSSRDVVPEGSEGASRKKRNFLYQIVSSRTGIDVDRFDYFARDCHHVGIPNSFDHQRLTKRARVIHIKEKDEWNICFFDQEVSNIYNLFITRYNLYKDVYLHLPTMTVQLMIAEAFKEANEHLLFDTNGKSLKISQALSQMDTYTKLTDRLYYDILWSSDDKLKKAKGILERLERRELFTVVGQRVLTKKTQLPNEEKIAEEIIAENRGPEVLQVKDLIVKLIFLGFGTKDEANPLTNVYIYSKTDMNKATKISECSHLTFLKSNTPPEESLRVYCKDESGEKLKAARKAFASWCNKYDMKPEIGNDSSLTNEPLLGLQQDERYKIFNDSIHGTLSLHPLLIKIIDTPEFQRLRDLKQLGGVYHTNQGASHSRFEHSIGVAYLAVLFLETLKKKQPELNITDKELLCVHVAGLCHDLGHGPFSHIFDGDFIPQVAPEKKWKHEKGSSDMLRHLIQSNNLTAHFEKYNLEARDIDFICDLIHGDHEKCEDPKRIFLYEVVSNKRTGLDVDRWDYFARDCHYLGIKNNFDHQRYIQLARVIGGRICVLNQEAVNVYSMFIERYSLYRAAYCEVTAMAVQIMIGEALAAADKYLTFPGKGGKLKRKLSESIDDMVAYTQVTDNVYYKILWWEPPCDATDACREAMLKAKKLLRRIEKHDLYVLIGKTHSFSGEEYKLLCQMYQLQENCQPKELERCIAEDLVSIHKTASDKALFGGGDIVAKVVKLDFGTRDAFPLTNVLFYTEGEPNQQVKIESKSLPPPIKTESATDRHIRVYLKDEDKNAKTAEQAKRAFKAWNSKRCADDADLQVI